MDVKVDKILNLCVSISAIFNLATFCHLRVKEISKNTLKPFLI